MIAASGPTAFWYLARGSGLVAFVLLTLSLVLGIVTSVRWSNERWPRFAIQLVHRNVSLLVMVFIGVHIATVVLDGFAPIGWKDAVIPFAAGYRALWLGLGALGFDVLLAVLVTSLLRDRIGQRTWRFVHWFSYVCWPLVLLHGVGSGTDTKVGLVLVTEAACVVAVLLAVWWRLAVGWPDRLGVRAAGLAASIVGPVLLVVWMAGGPLAAGWARKAGTPASLLPRAVSTSASSSGSASPAPSRGASSLPTPPFSAEVSGTLTQSRTDARGRLTVRITTTLSGGASGTLDYTLQGRALDDGGVLLDASTVTLGPRSQPDLYRGEVTSLRGTDIVAVVRRAGAASLRVSVALQIDQASGGVSGRLDASAATG